MRTPTIAALLLAATACSSCSDDPQDTTTGTDADALLNRTADLAGRPIIESTDGRWIVRRTATPDRSGGLRLERGAEGAMLEVSESRSVMTATDDAARFETADGVDTFAGAASPLPSAGLAEVAPSFVAAEVGAGSERLIAAMESPSPTDGAAAAPLRAGSTDDNADFAAFLTYLAEKQARQDLADRWQPLDVQSRRAIRVVDAEGNPLPGARIQVVDEVEDRVAWRGTTQGDGRVPFYPGLASSSGATPAGTVLIEVDLGDGAFRQHWDLSGDECVVRLPEARDVQADEVALDVVFVIDTTGSMGDEIDRIKATLRNVTNQLGSLEREFTLRYGAVLYRDVGDDYVTSEHAFTTDLDAFAEALQKIEASGGGDGPESLNQGLAVAVDGMDWRPGAAHLAFLIADAPPHMDYDNDVPYGDSVRAAIGKGIRIHTVAASGLDEVGSLVFRQIAQATRGDFVFIEYGGDVAASGAAHGVAGAKKSNNLDDILFAKIRDEIATWGRDA